MEGRGRGIRVGQQRGGRGRGIRRPSPDKPKVESHPGDLGSSVSVESHSGDRGSSLSVESHPGDLGSSLLVESHPGDLGSSLLVESHPGGDLGSTLSVESHPGDLGSTLSVESHPGDLDPLFLDDDVDVDGGSRNPSQAQTYYVATSGLQSQVVNLDEARVAEETNKMKDKVKDYLMAHREGVECKHLERELIGVHDGDFNYRHLAYDRLGLFLYAVAKDVFIVAHETDRDPYEKQTPLILFIHPSCMAPDNLDQDIVRLVGGDTVNRLVYCKDAKVLKNRTSASDVAFYRQNKQFPNWERERDPHQNRRGGGGRGRGRSNNFLIPPRFQGGHALAD